MKVITYNLNGIRAALKKDLIGFIKRENPDVICFQELKANSDQFDVKEFENLGYNCTWFSAQKKGYSGVAILTKKQPQETILGCGHSLFDDEGRVVSALVDDTLYVSAYFPSGTTGDVRQNVKYEFLDHFYNWIEGVKGKYSKLIVCGDYNICHKEIDIHNPVSNKNSSGFLPEERAWMDKWFDSGFVDSFRNLNPEPHNYTWWSYRAGARKNNKGWRIDYISLSENIIPLKAGLFTNDIHSDHCGSYVIV
jgi:exodeoxyribonuclease-3